MINIFSLLNAIFLIIFFQNSIQIKLENFLSQSSLLGECFVCSSNKTELSQVQNYEELKSNLSYWKNETFNEFFNIKSDKLQQNSMNIYYQRNITKINEELYKLYNQIKKIEEMLIEEKLKNKKLEEKLNNLNNLNIGLIGYFEGDCPRGWEEYLHSQGRFILSAGNLKQISLDGRNESALFTVTDKGGEMYHKLKVEEMPIHNHITGEYSELLRNNGFYTNSVGSDTTQGEPDIYESRRESNAGGDIPHYNMPPYLVLRVCRKKIGDIL